MGGRGGPARQKSESSQAPAPAAVASPATVMENAIRKAFDDLMAREPGKYSWASLDELRQRLPGTKAEQDAMMKEMVTRDVNYIRLIPEENQQTITQADRAAAIRLFGQDKHLIYVAPRGERRD